MVDETALHDWFGVEEGQGSPSVCACDDNANDNIRDTSMKSTTSRQTMVSGKEGGNIEK